MKKNLLFINMFWVFFAGLFGTFLYLANRQVEGVWVLSNLKSIVKALWIPGLISCLCLLLAIPLGRCPKNRRDKIDCALFEFLITEALVAIVLLLIAGDNIKYVPKGFSKIFHYFIIFSVGGYLLGLSVVCLLKACFKLIFGDLKEENLVSKVSLLISPTMVWSGIFVCLCHAKMLKNANIIKSYNGYLTWMNTGVLIAIIVVCVFIVLAHVLASLKTKKGKSPVICAIVGLIVAFFIVIVTKYKLFTLPAKFTRLNEVSVFIVGAYLIPAFILLACYCLRPYIQTIGAKGVSKVEETVEEENTEVTDENADEVEVEETVEEETAEESDASENEEVVEENDEIKELKEELAKSNQEIEDLKKKLDEHLSSCSTFLVPTARKETFTTENLTDKSHYETELKTTITRGFKSKLILANDELKHTYSELLNIVFKFKRGNVRHAFAKDSIVLGRTKVAVLKMSPSSKAMYMYINLPASYLEITKYHLKDFSEKTKSMAATPYRLRIRSERSMKYAIELLEAAFVELGAIEFKTPREKIDYTEDLAIQTEEQMITNGLIKKKVVEETYLVEPIYASEDIAKKDEVPSVENTVNSTVNDVESESEAEDEDENEDEADDEEVDVE